jgi:biopolymer transport protein TolR
MRKKIAEPGNVRADINVTPLVDVCLVMLIIFMVVTPLIRQDCVRLPETRKPPAMAEAPQQITLTLRADGTLSQGALRFGNGELPALLAGLRAENPDRRVVVRGDAHLRYGEVREVLRQVSTAGFKNAGLAAARRPER